MVVFALVVVVVFVIELFTKLLPKEILWTCWFVEGVVQPNAECQSIQKQKRLKIMQKLG